MNSLPVRYRHPERDWASLSPHDLRALDDLMRNEADMAYRRRVKILLDYLEISDDERVLDLGCGMGFFLMALGRIRDARSVGFDYDMQRLVRAHRENPGVRFICGRLSDLPFPEGFFDKILLSEVLEHLEDDLAGLREIHRVLKPGGLLAISVPHRNYPLIWDPINKIREALGLEPLRSGPWVGIWTNHERLYDPQGLAERLEAARFKVEIMEEATHYCFPFSHFIVYGIGKPLLEKGLLPEGIRQAADRFAAGGKKGGRLNPVNIGLAPFRWIDRLNDRPGVVKKRTFVNLLVKARKG